ncbi:MAG: hypothetical protein WGN25_06700 [Candidatus Electrothrix sp. GW3-4]|uniref:hypothetical protein n=1 Tax=Candidatus Electrothrix sp. GW3-4 TaxID=3126740 RepID=UPI0030CC8657
MTKSKLRQSFYTVGVIYFVALICGIVFRVLDPSREALLYNTYKDLIPFVIIMPATWLGYCLQQRISYMQQLRIIWSNLVATIQSAHQYTFLEDPSPEQYAEILKQISISIDEIRGVFDNLYVTADDVGLYPFEPLKDVWQEIAKIAPGNTLSKEDRKVIRQAVFRKWQEMRIEFLKEFDRHVPASPILDKRKTGE